MGIQPYYAGYQPDDAAKCCKWIAISYACGNKEKPGDNKPNQADHLKIFVIHVVSIQSI